LAIHGQMPLAQSDQDQEPQQVGTFSRSIPGAAVRGRAFEDAEALHGRRCLCTRHGCLLCAWCRGDEFQQRGDLIPKTGRRSRPTTSPNRPCLAAKCRHAIGAGSAAGLRDGLCQQPAQPRWGAEASPRPSTRRRNQLSQSQQTSQPAGDIRHHRAPPQSPNLATGILFGALTTSMPLTLLLPGRPGWNGAVEDKTTAIAAALGPVGPRLKQLPARLGVTLTRTPGGVQTWKINVPASNSEPSPKSHEGYEWLFALPGRMRLILGGPRPCPRRRRGGRARHPGAALVRQHRRPASRDPQHVQATGRGRASPSEGCRQEGFRRMRMA